VTTLQSTSHTIVVPIGHAVGSYPDRGRGLRYEVRRLADVEHLDEQEATAWALSHGELASGPVERPARHDGRQDGPHPALSRLEWSLDTFAQKVGGLAASDERRPAAHVVAGLVDRGLLVATPVAGAQAMAFAQRHRLVPLLLGLGPSSSMPDGYGIGLPGVEMLAVAPHLYEIWAHSPMHATIWDTCHWFAHVSGTDGPDGQADPGPVVTAVLANLHAMLSCSALYVEEAVAYHVAEPLRERE
jgi:hypothetical protein